MDDLLYTFLNNIIKEEYIRGYVFIITLIMCPISFILTDMLFESICYNHGRCKKCNGKLKHVDFTPRYNIRIHRCENCGYTVRVSYDSIDHYKRKEK